MLLVILIQADNHQTFVSHNSEGWKTMNMLPVRLESCENSLVDYRSLLPLYEERDRDLSGHFHESS